MLRAVGTPGYISPEILESLETNEPYGPETDIWSAGVIMYILLCGFPPFYGDDEEDVYDQICEGEYSYPSPYWDGISDAAKDLIDKCLVLNPKNRITAHHALRHPWIAVKWFVTPSLNWSRMRTEMSIWRALLLS